MIEHSDAAKATTPLHGRIANVELDERRRQLLCKGKPVAIEPKPFDLLCLLIRRQGEAVSKDELIASL
ncbi:MAG: hypothetical protein ABF271_14705, partial [Abyssibacter sp.]